MGNTEALASVGLVDKTRFTMGAQVRGTDVHHATFLLDKGKLDWSSVDPVKGWLMAYRRAKALLKMEIIAREEIRANLLVGYATKIDIECRLLIRSRRLALVEIKTGDPEDWWGKQLALQDMTFKTRHDCYAIQLFGNGKFKLHADYKGRRFGCERDRRIAIAAVAVANEKRRLA